MRKYTNLFFIIYLVDGALSLLHEIAAGFLQIEPTSGLRNLVAVAALLLAMPLYMSLGIDRRLPKLIIIPQILFIFWVGLGAWPIVITNGSFGLLAAFVQTLLGLLPFILYAGTAGSNRLLPEERFHENFFGLRNTLLFFSLHIVLLPLAFGYMAVSVLAQYADSETAGFVRLGSDGLHMEERVYSLSGKNIRLTGMIHIGEQEFYSDLIDSTASGRTVILAEGVTDKDSLLTSSFGYDSVAQLLGLTSQADVEFPGQLIDESDLTEMSLGEYDALEPHIIHADTDLSRFDPQTIEFINVLGKHLFNSDSLPQGLQAYDAWARENVTPETSEIIFGDLLDLRNEVVLSWVDRVLPFYDTIVIPWGALHMPGIEAAILDRGFRQVSSRERLSVDFASVPVSGILQKLAEPPAEKLDEKIL